MRVVTTDSELQITMKCSAISCIGQLEQRGPEYLKKRCVRNITKRMKKLHYYNVLPVNIRFLRAAGYWPDIPQQTFDQPRPKA